MRKVVLGLLISVVLLPATVAWAEDIQPNDDATFLALMMIYTSIPTH
jgi:hypothetical protein